ncbi:MAG: CRISPR system precrRNA processing endoribonuclease RAMP protein Cas6 [Methanobacteriota archaeon]
MKRRSNRQNMEMEKGGLLGDITYEGELAEFMPFIKLGEFLHIGAGTAYGLGKYEIMEDIE